MGRLVGPIIDGRWISIGVIAIIRRKGRGGRGKGEGSDIPSVSPDQLLGNCDLNAPAHICDGKEFNHISL